MIGPKIMIAAWLLLSTVLAYAPESFPSLVSLTGDYVNKFVLDVCGPDLQAINGVTDVCASASKVAIHANTLNSLLRCSDYECDAKFDPVSKLCRCVWGSTTEIDEDQIWPGKDCAQTTTCYAPLEAHWNPNTSECMCAIAAFPDDIHQSLLVWSPQPVEQSHELAAVEDVIQRLHHLTQDADEVRRQGTGHCQYLTSPDRGFLTRWLINIMGGKKICRDMEDVTIRWVKLKMNILRTHSDLLNEIGTPARKLVNRLATRGAIPVVPVQPAFIPPPNTQVTQELIQESLSLQPQQTATVGSVIPHFADGVITFLVQLDGPISQTLSINATDTLPCDNIGSDPQPNLILIPNHVINGTSELILPTCLIIAVNVYDPKYITYWILRTEDGTVHSLLSDNKIHAIDQLDTSKPISVAVRVAANDKKRAGETPSDINLVPIERRQIFSVDCGAPCPFHFMQPIHGAGDYCGCLLDTGDKTLKNTRGLESPSPYTVTMSAEACAAMTCLNNGGKPAIFNPFTATCWCASPALVQENDSAYNGGM